MRQAVITNNTIEAEQNVLGSFLLNGESLLIASEIISAADFYKESHRYIFNACCDIFAASEEINILSLSEELSKKGQLEDAGGNSYLTFLATITPTAANVGYFARIVKDKATIRRVKILAANISQQADGPVESIPGWISEIERGLLDISSGIQEKKSPYAEGILQEVVTRWEEVDKGEKRFIETDSKLSDLIPVFGPHFWILAGYTSNGKSALLNQILIDSIESGIRPLIFSLEDTREEKILKMISNLAGIPQKNLIIGDLQGKELKISKAIETIKTWRPIIYDNVYSLAEIRLKSRKHKLQDGINLIAIDYLQNVKNTGDLYADMRMTSLELDIMKKDLDCTIIGLSQITNEAVKTKSSLIALKGAGELAAAADIVLWLEKKEAEGKERWLNCVVRKNRPFGETGILPLIFNESWTEIYKRGF
ncbi:MAG: replicative DNA helicase [Nitrospirota bacterium]|nr:replicative DNA helicase [Nitrospirota bacterium]